MQKKVMQIVDAICNMCSADCRSLNKADMARELTAFPTIISLVLLCALRYSFNQVFSLTSIEGGASREIIHCGHAFRGNTKRTRQMSVNKVSLMKSEQKDGKPVYASWKIVLGFL